MLPLVHMFHLQVEAEQILKQVVIKIYRNINHSCAHKITLNNFCSKGQ